MTRTTFILVVLLFVSASAFAGDFEDGLAAYDRGDYATAISKFRKSAKQGDADAQAYLGFMYYNGQGVPKDYKQSLYWGTKAAEQGDADAQFNVGLMYGNGLGVPRNYKQALYWSAKAAEQGNADAQSYLGSLYSSGQGVPRNYIEAYKWLSLAAAQYDESDEDARMSLDSLEYQMTPEQVAEAQRLAREWRPR